MDSSVRMSNADLPVGSEAIDEIEKVTVDISDEVGQVKDLVVEGEEVNNTTCQKSDHGQDRDDQDSFVSDDVDKDIDNLDNDHDCVGNIRPGPADLDQDLDSIDDTEDRDFETFKDQSSDREQPSDNVFDEEPEPEFDEKVRSYIHRIREKHQDELCQMREIEDDLRLQLLNSNKREDVLYVRLRMKESEVKHCQSQVKRFRSMMVPTDDQLRTSFLDPAVNLIIERLRKELTETKKKLEDTQNDLNAWKFTPDSNTGKRLMAKCRMLYQENEELGKMVSTGRIAKLENDLALQRSLTAEMKKSQSELDDLVQEIDEDVEGMQSTIYYLQEELREANPKSTDASSHVYHNVNVGELCAQCHAVQEKKREEKLAQQKTVESEFASSRLKRKHGTYDADSFSPSSSVGNMVIDSDYKTTCVNGEFDDSSDHEDVHKVDHDQEDIEQDYTTYSNSMQQDNASNASDVRTSKSDDKSVCSTFVRNNKCDDDKRTLEDDSSEDEHFTRKRELLDSEALDSAAKRTKISNDLVIRDIHIGHTISDNSNTVDEDNSVLLTPASCDNVTARTSTTTTAAAISTANGNGSLAH